MLKKKILKKAGVVISIAALSASQAQFVQAEGKPTITLMIDIPGYQPLNTAVEMVKEKFPEYDIVSKTWVYEDVKKSIKTTFASGSEETIDIAFSDSRLLRTYYEADMLLDLTPYLEADENWKNSFYQSTLEAGCYDGGYYGVPWQTAYPVLVANNKILDEAGVEIKENMSYDDWMAVAKQIKDAGYFAFSGEVHGWFMRQAFLNAFDTREDLDAFVAGEIPFTDERVVQAVKNAAEVFNEEYVYPGVGAVASTTDEGKAGFANERVAFFCVTNNMVATIPGDTGIEDISVVTFPSFSNTGTEFILGSPDCYFVPANCKNVEETIEVLKYLTSDEVMLAMADLGVVVCNQNVTGSLDIYDEISKDMDKVYSNDISQLSDELADAQEAAVANYMYEGESTLDKMEELRIEATE